MSSVEDRLNSAAPISGEKPVTGPLQLPGDVSELSPIEQLPFPAISTRPAKTTPLEPQPSPGVTRPLPQPIMLPAITRNLPEIRTGALPPLRSTTSTLRQPVVIRSTGKKSTGIVRPPQGRRWVIQVAVSLILLLFAVGTLLAVAPAGMASEYGFNPFQPIMSWVQGGNSNPSLLAQQAATVTAVTQDGYQPPNNQTYPGLPAAPPGVGNYDGFTFGQCTYWADFLYHQLTGVWVPWGGDAWEWANGARAYGWNVSSTPRVPSIIVLQPYVQGASPFGHVAVVVSINSDGSVVTSNMNWYAGGGGWDRVSYWTFYPGPGVSFVWV